MDAPICLWPGADGGPPCSGAGSTTSGTSSCTRFFGSGSDDSSSTFGGSLSATARSGHLPSSSSATTRLGLFSSFSSSSYPHRPPSCSLRLDCYTSYITVLNSSKMNYEDALRLRIALLSRLHRLLLHTMALNQPPPVFCPFPPYVRLPHCGH